MHVHIQPAAESGESPIATVGGQRFPLLGYAIEPGDDGAVVVSLVFTPSSLAFGNPLAGPPEKTAEPVRVWGSPGRDPRESIPGWNPASVSEVTASLAAQVAANAEQVAR